MSCERYEEDVVEAALGTARTEGLATHLEACSSCRSRLAEERGRLSTLDDVLRSTLAIDPSAGFEGRVRLRVAARRSWGQAAGWRWAVAGVAALALLSLVLRAPRPELHEAARARPAPPKDLREESTSPVPDTTRFTRNQSADDTKAGREPSMTRVRPRPAPPGRRVAPADPEVLIAPDAAAALRRYRAGLATQRVYISSLAPRTEADMMLQAPRSRLEPLRVHTLDDLPRPKTLSVRGEDESPATGGNAYKGGGM